MYVSRRIMGRVCNVGLRREYNILDWSRYCIEQLYSIKNSSIAVTLDLVDSRHSYIYISTCISRRIMSRICNIGFRKYCTLNWSCYCIEQLYSTANNYIDVISDIIDSRLLLILIFINLLFCFLYM